MRGSIIVCLLAIQLPLRQAGVVPTITTCHELECVKLEEIVWPEFNNVARGAGGGGGRGNGRGNGDAGSGGNAGNNGGTNRSPQSDGGQTGES